MTIDLLKSSKRNKSLKMETFVKLLYMKTDTPLMMDNSKTTLIQTIKFSWKHLTKGKYLFQKRQIPKELRKKYPTGALSVSLSDKTGQKYVPPPPPSYVAFSGSGTSLGGARTGQVDSKFSKKSKAC